MNDKSSKRARLHRSGAVAVEYVVMLVIMLGVALASVGLGIALARNSQRADNVLRSNSP